MKVKATRMGYYGKQRVREGQVFALTDPKHFAETWMQKIEAPQPAQSDAVESPAEQEGSAATPPPRAARGKKKPGDVQNGGEPVALSQIDHGSAPGVF